MKRCKKERYKRGNWGAALAASMVGSTSVVPERFPGVGRLPPVQVEFPSRDRSLLLVARKGGWGLFGAQAPEPSKPISVLPQHTVYYHVYHWNLILWKAVKHQKEIIAQFWTKSQPCNPPPPYFQMKELNVYFSRWIFLSNSFHGIFLTGPLWKVTSCNRVSELHKVGNR